MSFLLFNLHAQVTEDVPVIPGFTDHYPLNWSLEGYSLDDLDFYSFSSGNYSENHEAPPDFSTPSVEISQPTAEMSAKKHKMSPSGSSSQIISFRSSGSPLNSPESKPLCGADYAAPVVKPKAEVACSEGNVSFASSHLISQDNSHQIEANMEAFSGQRNCGSKRTYSAMSRSHLHAQDHVIAERKRREKLSERFIALAAVIPGLKKVCRLK